jgi:hypothetical protein
MIDNFTETVDKLLGKPVDSPEVKVFLVNLDATENLEIDPDDGTAYISREELGFSLLFKEAGWIKNPSYASLPKNTLVFVSCFYYAEGHEGYRQFSGELPRGLSFSDSRDDVHKKLGPPSWQRERNGRVISEKWVFGDRSLHVTYSRNTGKIAVIVFGIPQEF